MRQLDLFNPLPADYCGRGLGPCQAVVENGQIYCRTCGGIGWPRASMFDGFQNAILKDQKFRREPESPSGNDPGK
jgi:hypothetical protein